MSAGTSRPGALVDRFRKARRDRELAVVEGFHALKHALRFDAEILAAVSPDPTLLAHLAHDLAPDIEARLQGLVSPIDQAAFAAIAPRAPQTGVVAIARRSSSLPAESAVEALLTLPAPAPVVMLEQPRDMGNTGACIRVAAAAEAAGVIVTGRHDPWHADALRGSAGLHFVLPVLWAELPGGDTPQRASAHPPGEDDAHGASAHPLDDGDHHGASAHPLNEVDHHGASAHPLNEVDPRAHYRSRSKLGDRPLVALDPAGDPLVPTRLPRRAILAFGSERSGLSQSLLARADLTVRIPMAPGVSSLNLATSVAAVLFAMRLGVR